MNPDVLRWARESAGWSIEDSAARLDVDKRSLEAWESSPQPLRYKALLDLAAQYKRPVAALLLSKPPSELAPPTDFRALPGKRGAMGSETLLAIRRATRLQALARELLTAFGRSIAPQISKAVLTDDPEQVAEAERATLGVSIEDQLGWGGSHEAFRRWRADIEERNVLVFQFAMPLEDCRGFSLAEQEPLVIVVNSADAIAPRTFTLFHEFGHLLLRTPGVCIPEVKASRAPGKAETAEGWCNRFAAAFLIPANAVRVPPEATTSERALTEFLKSESKRFKVSREVLLRRLLDLGAVRRNQFARVLARLRAEHHPVKRTGGFTSPAKRSVEGRGRLLSSLILDAVQSGFLNHADAADYLSLRLKHLGEVQSLLAA